MSEGVLVIAEARRGELRDVSLELFERGVRIGRSGQRPAGRRRVADALNVAGVETIRTAAASTTSRTSRRPR